MAVPATPSLWGSVAWAGWSKLFLGPNDGWSPFFLSRIQSTARFKESFWGLAYD